MGLLSRSEELLLLPSGRISQIRVKVTILDRRGTEVPILLRLNIKGCRNLDEASMILP